MDGSNTLLTNGHHHCEVASAITQVNIGVTAHTSTRGGDDVLIIDNSSTQLLLDWVASPMTIHPRQFTTFFDSLSFPSVVITDAPTISKFIKGRHIPLDMKVRGENAVDTNCTSLHSLRIINLIGKVTFEMKWHCSEKSIGGGKCSFRGQGHSFPMDFGY
mmetsp:Transcript_14127/g.23376  ORF Transcript_14127/g.23376 Transcript_14127/m.23376 type:complete len:160 (+) Transcript_14127:94-573(+)